MENLPCPYLIAIRFEIEIKEQVAQELKASLAS